MTVDRPYLNLRLKAADILRLAPGDIVALRISRPIASEERELVIAAWLALMAQHGLKNVDLMIIGGVESELSVMRPAATTEP